MRNESLLINGYFFGGPCDSSVGKQVVRSAVDGSIFGTAGEGGLNDLQNCIASAFEAQTTWSRSSLDFRRDLLLRISAAITDQRESLASALVHEIAKPIRLALGEVDRAAVTFALAAEAIEMCGPTDVDLSADPRGVNYTATTQLVSRGVIFGIVPYNWPINLAAHKIAPAIASGSAIVLKPSPFAPMATLALARIVHDCGVPPGTINAWNGPTPNVAKVLGDPRIAVISFTGSDRVGWDIKANHPRKHVVLECGGDAFVIVLPGTDLAAAVPLIYTGAFAYAGQICISVQHVLIHESIYDSFFEALIAYARVDRSTDLLDQSTICGPMIDSDAADRVIGLIDDAIERGARIAIGGNRIGTYIEPTILTDSSADCRLCYEEAFGPVVLLHRISNVEGGISRVNTSRFGIHAGVFGDDAPAVASRLDVGGVVVNDVPTVRFDALPYGGVRDSGCGREGVGWAVREFTQPRSTVSRRRA